MFYQKIKFLQSELSFGEFNEFGQKNGLFQLKPDDVDYSNGTSKTVGGKGRLDDFDGDGKPNNADTDMDNDLKNDSRTDKDGWTPKKAAAAPAAGGPQPSGGRELKKSQDTKDAEKDLKDAEGRIRAIKDKAEKVRSGDFSGIDYISTGKREVDIKAGLEIVAKMLDAAEKDRASAEKRFTENMLRDKGEFDTSTRYDETRLTSGATITGALEQTKQAGINATASTEAKFLDIAGLDYSTLNELQKKYFEQQLGPAANDKTKTRHEEVLAMRAIGQLSDEGIMPAKYFGFGNFKSFNAGETKKVPLYHTIKFSRHGFERVTDNELSDFKYYFIPEGSKGIELSTDLVNVNTNDGTVAVVEPRYDNDTKSYGYFNTLTGKFLTIEESRHIYCKATLEDRGAPLDNDPANPGKGDKLENYFVPAEESKNIYFNQSLGAKGQDMFSYLDCLVENDYLKRQLAELLSGMGEMGFMEIIMRLAMLLWQSSCSGALKNESNDESVKPDPNDLASIINALPMEQRQLFSGLTGIDASSSDPEVIRANFMGLQRALSANDPGTAAEIFYNMCKMGLFGPDNQAAIAGQSIDVKDLTQVILAMPEDVRKKYGEAMSGKWQDVAELNAFGNQLSGAGLSPASAEYLQVYNAAKDKFVERVLLPEFNRTLQDVVINQDQDKNKKGEVTDLSTVAEDNALKGLLSELKNLGVTVHFDSAKTPNLDLSAIQNIKVTPGSGANKYEIEILGAKNKKLLNKTELQISSSH